MSARNFTNFNKKKIKNAKNSRKKTDWIEFAKKFIL